MNRLTAPGVHGGLDLQELRGFGVAPKDVLDFSVCTNPFGPSPRVRAASAAAALDRYPDRNALDLRTAVSDVLGVAMTHVLGGNGASELIWLAALALLRPGDRVLIVGPTYGEYARAAALAGARVQFLNAQEANGFTVPVAEIEQALSADPVRVVFLANPNNPTGASVQPEALARWARRYERTMFVLDEAYQPFAPALPSVIRHARHNLLVLRSLTKDYSLAGLRLGYAVGEPRLLALLAQAQPPWSVNAVAQAAGVAALRDPEHLAWSLDQLRAACQEMQLGLAEMGRRPVPSAAHFFLLDVGDGAAVRQALMQRAILVRDCASFGLPTYIRIGPRRREENARLLAALREVLA